MVTLVGFTVKSIALFLVVVKPNHRPVHTGPWCALNVPWTISHSFAQLYFCLYVSSNELASTLLRRWFLQAQCDMSYAVMWYHSPLTYLMLAMEGWNNGTTRFHLSVWGEQNIQNQLDSNAHNRVVYEFQASKIQANHGLLNCAFHVSSCTAAKGKCMTTI